MSRMVGVGHSFNEDKDAKLKALEKKVEDLNKNKTQQDNKIKALEKEKTTLETKISELENIKKDTCKKE